MNLRVVALCLLLSITCHAQTPDTIAITGVTVIDTVNGSVIPNRTVTISGGTIRSITPTGALPQGVQVIDGRGKFLVPGMWDMHAHLFVTGEEALSLYVANGVTGTRDMGTPLDPVLQIRERTASGQVLGPQIVAAGPILDNAPPEWPARLKVVTAEDGRNAVRMLKERGVDFVKVHDRTPPAAYVAIAAEAKLQNLPLAGHVPRGITFEQAAASGQRSIEHLASFRVYTQCSGGAAYSAERCRTFFDWLAKSGMWQTPTLVSWRGMFTIGTPAGDPEKDHFAYATKPHRDFLALNQQFSNVSAEGIRGLIAASDTAAVALSDMQKAGVGILAGCDGMVPGFCVHDELLLFVRGGMSPLAALQTATLNPARYLGLEGSLGSVEVGKTANLVLLDGNPLEDIENIRRIHAVILRDRVLDRNALDAVLEGIRGQ